MNKEERKVQSIQNKTTKKHKRGEIGIYLSIIPMG
jgi:hypothetical protein